MLTPSARESLLKEVLGRTQVFGPPKGFEPLKAAAPELLRYGFPVEPDCATMPECHAFWSRMHAGPLDFVAPEFALPDEPRLQRIAPQRQRGTLGGRREKSLNWSGAYIKPTRGRAFTEIHAEWVVPKPVAPLVRGEAKPRPGKYRSVCFIGLDGQRRYRHSSLPQIGTASGVDVDAYGKSTVITYAWWQWWVRGQDRPEMVIASVPVVPGDAIICSLVVISPTSVRFYLKNQRTGRFFGAEVQSPSITIPNAPPIRLKVSGATAAWITERPSAFDAQHTLFELPDYGKVNYSNCYAISSCPGCPEQVQKLSLATLIKMRATRKRPHRSVTVSVADLKNDQSFTTRYSG